MIVVAPFRTSNHDKIDDILLDSAQEAGPVNLTGLTDWSLTRSTGNWCIKWQGAEAPALARCTLLVAADGTASTVRDRLRIGLDRHHYQLPIALLFGRQRGVADERTLDVYLAKDSAVSLIPRTGGETKVGFPVSPEDIAALKADSEVSLLHRLAEWCRGILFDSLVWSALINILGNRIIIYSFFLR